MAIPRLAFSNLNLRFNPFGELEPQMRKSLAVVDSKECINHLENARAAVQFVADHGRGKSTHLLALHQYFSQSPYIKLEQGNIPPIPSSEILFIDSLEILRKGQRKRVFRGVQRIAYTAHRDISTELTGMGFNVLSKKVSCLDADTLQEIFQKRIEFARRGPGDIPVVSRETVEALITEYHDDVRAMESCLYERLQKMKTVGYV